MSMFSSAGRPLSTSVQALIRLAGVLLIAEVAHTVSELGLLINWDLQLFHRIYFSWNFITMPFEIFLLAAAAKFCFSSPDVVFTRGLVPALMLIPYGVWIAYQNSRVFGHITGSLLTVSVLGFVSGVAFVLCGLLILSAIRIEDQRRSSRLRALHGI